MSYIEADNLQQEDIEEPADVFDIVYYYPCSWDGRVRISAPACELPTTHRVVDGEVDGEDEF